MSRLASLLMECGFVGTVMDTWHYQEVSRKALGENSQKALRRSAERFSNLFVQCTIFSLHWSLYYCSQNPVDPLSVCHLASFR